MERKMHSKYKIKKADIPEFNLSPKIEELQKQLEKDPYSTAFLSLAKEYYKSKMLDEAIFYLEDGLSKNPNFHHARVALAKYLMEKGDIQKAKQSIDNVLENVPVNVLALRIGAEISITDGDFSEARERLEKVLELNPMDMEAQMMLKELGGKAAQSKIELSRVEHSGTEVEITRTAPEDMYPSAQHSGDYVETVKTPDNHVTNVESHEQLPEEQQPSIRPEYPQFQTYTEQQVQPGEYSPPPQPIGQQDIYHHSMEMEAPIPQEQRIDEPYQSQSTDSFLQQQPQSDYYSSQEIYQDQPESFYSKQDQTVQKLQEDIPLVSKEVHKTSPQIQDAGYIDQKDDQAQYQQVYDESQYSSEHQYPSAQTGDSVEKRSFYTGPPTEPLTDDYQRSDVSQADQVVEGDYLGHSNEEAETSFSQEEYNLTESEISVNQKMNDYSAEEYFAGGSPQIEVQVSETDEASNQYDSVISTPEVSQQYDDSGLQQAQPSSTHPDFAETYKEPEQITQQRPWNFQSPEHRIEEQPQKEEVQIYWDNSVTVRDIEPPAPEPAQPKVFIEGGAFTSAQREQPREVVTQRMPKYVPGVQPEFPPEPQPESQSIPEWKEEDKSSQIQTDQSFVSKQPSPDIPFLKQADQQQTPYPSHMVQEEQQSGVLSEASESVLPQESQPLYVGGDYQSLLQQQAVEEESLQYEKMPQDAYTSVSRQDASDGQIQEQRSPYPEYDDIFIDISQKQDSIAVQAPVDFDNESGVSAGMDYTPAEYKQDEKAAEVTTARFEKDSEKFMGTNEVFIKQEITDNRIGDEIQSQQVGVIEDTSTVQIPEQTQEKYSIDLAELYEKQGFYDKAIEVYRSLLETDPDNQVLVQRLIQAEKRRNELAKLPPRPKPNPMDGISKMEEWFKSVTSGRDNEKDIDKDKI